MADRPGLIIDNLKFRTGTFGDNCTISVTIESVAPSVFGGSDGTATANIIGDKGDVSYLWSNGATTKVITGLIAGVYSVTATDAITTNCASEATTTLVDPPIVEPNLLQRIISSDKTTINTGDPLPVAGDPIDIMADESSNGNDMTQSVAGDRPIVRDGHIDFVSNDGLINASTDFEFSTDWTVLIWSNPDMAASTQAIIGKHGFTPNRGWIVDQFASKWQLIYSTDGSNAIFLDSGAPAIDATWSLVVIVVKKNVTVGISATVEGGPSAQTLVTHVQTSELSIANRGLEVGVTTGNNFNGQMGRWEIWKEAKDQAYIETFYQAGHL